MKPRLEKTILPVLLLAACITTAHAATLTLGPLGGIVRSVGQQDALAGFYGNADINNGVREVNPGDIPYLQVDAAGDFNQDFSLNAVVPFASVHTISSHHSTISLGPASLHIVANLHVTNSVVLTNDGPAISDADGNYVSNGHYGYGRFGSSTTLSIWFTIDAPFIVKLSVTTSGIHPAGQTGGSEFSLLNTANIGSVSNGLDIGYGEGVPSGYNNYYFSHALPGPAGTQGTNTFLIEAGSYYLSAIATDANTTPPDGTLTVGNTSYAATRSVIFTLDVVPQSNWLDIQRLTNEVQLSWNATPTNWVLESTAAMSGTSWTNELTVPTVLNGTNSVLKPVSNLARFWRLRYQP